MSEPSERCTTCGDTSQAMRVVRAGARSEIAICAAADGAMHEVDVAVVGAVEPGETLIVHAGAALAREPV